MGVTSKAQVGKAPLVIAWGVRVRGAQHGGHQHGGHQHRHCTGKRKAGRGGRVTVRGSACGRQASLVHVEVGGTGDRRQSLAVAVHQGSGCFEQLCAYTRPQVGKHGLTQARAARTIAVDESPRPCEAHRQRKRRGGLCSAARFVALQMAAYLDDRHDVCLLAHHSVPESATRRQLGTGESRELGKIFRINASSFNSKVSSDRVQ